MGFLAGAYMQAPLSGWLSFANVSFNTGWRVDRGGWQHYVL